jgi:phospholipase/carboxylesterase
MLSTIFFSFIYRAVLAMTSVSNESNPPIDQELPLHCIIREGKVKSGDVPILILLHGFGSNEKDLFELAKGVSEEWMVVSVRGLHRIQENGYCWYDVKMVDGKITIDINELLHSKREIEKFTGDLLNKYKINGRRIVLAGFSQGANMAQSVGLANPNIICGFGVFSGRWVEEFKPYISKTSDLKEMKAFISHGTNDTMLKREYMEENLRLLKGLGVQCFTSEDKTGHVISPKQWNEFSIWLKDFN